MMNPVLIHNWQYLDNGWSLIDSLGAVIDLYTLPGREAISRDLCIGQTQHASAWLVAQISLRDQDSDFGLHRVRNVGALWRSIPGYHLLIRPPLAPAPISSDHAGMQANNPNTMCLTFNRICSNLDFGIQITNTVSKLSTRVLANAWICSSLTLEDADIPTLERNPFPLSTVGITRRHLWSRIHHFICSAVVLRFSGKNGLRLALLTLL